MPSSTRLPFQIRYVREKISMGDHGYLHGRMVAPSGRGMQFRWFGGGIARCHIDRLVANHNGEEEDYSWDSECLRIACSRFRRVLYHLSVYFSFSLFRRPNNTGSSMTRDEAKSIRDFTDTRTTVYGQWL